MKYKPEWLNQTGPPNAETLEIYLASRFFPLHDFHCLGFVHTITTVRSSLNPGSSPSLHAPLLCAASSSFIKLQWNLHDLLTESMFGSQGLKLA
jgi:hypothetical protein